MFQHRNFCQECFHPSDIYLQRLSIKKFLFSDRQKKSNKLTAMMIFRSKYYNYKRIILSQAPCLSSNLPAVEDGSANCAVDENPSFHFKLISLQQGPLSWDRKAPSSQNSVFYIDVRARKLTVILC